MAKIVSFFNHKGGVSKTTTTFHLGWMLVKKGYRVIVIDTDSQCNLTGLFLGEDNFESFYQDNPKNNIKAALDCAFEGQPVPIGPIEGISITDTFLLIPGSIDITEFDLSLGMAHNLSSSMPVLMNLPGVFNTFIEKMVTTHSADYVLIDMNPSLSEINKNLLMISDYFIIPTAPDYFSQMALTTLSDIIPKWKKWSSSAKNFFKESVYPFPNKSPKLLGIIMQNFTIRKGKPSNAFQEKIDLVIKNLNYKVIPAFEKEGMIFGAQKRKMQKDLNFCIATIPDFQSLVARMQDEGGPSCPVFDIPDELLNTGTVNENYKIKKQEFYNIFSSFADLVVELSQDE